MEGVAPTSESDSNPLPPTRSAPLAPLVSRTLNPILGILCSVLLEDRLQKLPTEIRGGMNIVRFDFHVVQVLEPENIAFAGFRNDATEEEPQLSERISGVTRGRVGERQVYIDTIDAVQTQLPQPEPDHLPQVGARLDYPHKGQIMVSADVDAHP